MIRSISNRLWLVLSLVIGFPAAAFAADNFPSTAESKNPTLPIKSMQGIHESGYVAIGGIDQWITIAGADRRNPVVLFLHGGPGDAWSLVADSLFAEWAKDLTLVQWDQRGAGRTYGKTGESIESTMTVERMTEDGIEVAEYLRRHLHQKKIILYGGSWGSVLGIRMAHARPDLFYAFVADGQQVSWQQSLAVGYSRIRELAQSRGDQSALDTLNAIGSPPWDSLEKYIPYHKILNAYETALTTAPRPPNPAIGSEYLAELKSGVYSRADDFSFHHFVGPTLSGPFTQVDLGSLADFKIPIYMVHGAFDLVNPTELAEAYFERIRAPRKQFYSVPGTAHEYSVASLNAIKDVLLTQVRPIVIGSR